MSWATPCLLAVLMPPFTSAVDAASPGVFRFEPPTLLNLGFEWDIAGDDNRNAAVEVSFREKGTSIQAAGTNPAPHWWRAHFPSVGVSRLHGAAPFCGQHPQPQAGYGLRVPLHDERPQWGNGRGSQVGHGPNPSGAEAHRRSSAARVSAQPRGLASAAGVRPVNGGVPGSVCRRLERAGGTEGEARRYDSRSCGFVQGEPALLRRPDRSAV